MEHEGFSISDLVADSVDDVKQGAPDYSFCGYQQFQLYIGGNQKVYRCCTTSYTDHGEIGDLKDKRLIDWIDTHRRYDFDARSCHHCQWNSKNRAIGYMVAKAPGHVNFV